MRLAAISVDLDEVLCYTEIHGLEPPPPGASHAVYRKALPRFERFFRELGIAATFFAVGRDLADASNAAQIAELHRQGHEIANHSADHRYDLTRLDRASIREQIAAGADAIAAAIGARPVGFRAPGYTVTDTLFEVLGELQVTYDSSVFPCPFYYAVKVAAIALKRAFGRRSRSIIGIPMVLAAPAEPYRAGRPYWRRGRGVLELPIGVTRCYSGRLPYIGTSVVLAGQTGARLLSRLMAGRKLVNLELHGIDLADAEQDDLGFLRPHRPDLRRSLRDREQALRAAIETLRKAGYSFVTLAEAARQFS